MNKVFSILFFVLIIGIVIFQYSRNTETNINYENFNLVAPGILRTPDERFDDLKDYPFKPNYLIIHLTVAQLLLDYLLNYYLILTY